jgi:hypothetical protein
MQQGQTLEFRYQIALIAAGAAASDPAEHGRRRACVVRAARRLASPR